MATYESIPNKKAGHDELSSPERPWRPGGVNQLPWTGLLALIVGFGCAIAALVISLMSQGKPLDYWMIRSYAIQPTVILAILTTLTNALLGYAFVAGIAIYWWTKALRGSTLRQLHSSHSRGDSLLALVSLKPIFNTVTLASLLTVILLMDQPLFQRGIRVVTQTLLQTRTLNIPITASPLQRGATGVIPDHSDDSRPALFHPVFAEVVRQYQSRDPIKIHLSECDRMCDTTIIAPGWDVQCTEWQTPYHFMHYWEWQQYYEYANNRTSIQYAGPPMIQQAFSVETFYFAEGVSLNDSTAYSYRINTSVMYKATTGANGTMNWHNCTLSEAIIRYPIEIANDTLRLKPMALNNNRTVHKVLRSLEMTGQGDKPSNLGGIFNAVDYQFWANASLAWIGGWSEIVTLDITSNTFLQVPPGSGLNDYNVTWTDPTNDIVSMAQELAFRVAVSTTNESVVTAVSPFQMEVPNLLTLGQNEVLSPNLTLVNRTLNQDAEVKVSLSKTVYEVQPAWLSGAFVVITLAWLAIIPTYWGWWRIGRPVSMSPLEIAKAFDAPLMQKASPNGTVDDHLRAIGSIKVRYGFHASGALSAERVHLPNSAPQYLSNVDIDARLNTDLSSTEQRQRGDIELQSLQYAVKIRPETHSDVKNIDSERIRLTDGSEAELLPTDSRNQEAAPKPQSIAAEASIRVLRFEEE